MILPASQPTMAPMIRNPMRCISEPPVRWCPPGGEPSICYPDPGDDYLTAWRSPSMAGGQTYPSQKVVLTTCAICALLAQMTAPGGQYHLTVFPIHGEVPGAAGGW